MRHLAHILVFSGILSVFFAALSGRPGRRLRLGAVLFAALAGGALVLGLVMGAVT
ncbi:MAG: hypothetical protein KBD01_04635 [Acidobacteria bacterium]|nr:hypothetical protein [Acidobacteriota bacterium]